MEIEIRKFCDKDIKETMSIWNDVVYAGAAFPQIEPLDEKTGLKFFKEQSFTGVALCNNQIVGLYILHPNNIGRCGHICNASYAVDKNMRGKHVGEMLVRHCIQKAKDINYRILQFNAVVATNNSALKLYEKLGFVKLGIIPNGFLMKDGTYQDIIPHYIELV